MLWENYIGFSGGSTENHRGFLQHVHTSLKSKEIVEVDAVPTPVEPVKPGGVDVKQV
ncbi:hypothetical protein Fmac_006379 [Flemingia macrophylla]|uniref:Uncharacterized protein n=1 Tax=Flemingia macrophylla TaxID=520843 RepID=A0ABD1NAF3_9FABA